MGEPRKPSKRGGGKPGKLRGGFREAEPRGAGRFSRPGPDQGRPTSQRKPSDAARHRATTALAKQMKRWPDLSLDVMRLNNLEARDAAFAQAIYDAVISRALTLKHLVEKGSKSEWDSLHPGVQATLLSGAAQLLILKRVPVRAALFESVEWAKREVSERSGGMVNAVLRRLDELIVRDEDGVIEFRPTATDRLDEIPMSDGSALVLREEVLPEDPLQRLSVTTSHPIALLRAWLKDHGMVETRRLAMHGLATPPVVLNVAFAKDELPQTLEMHQSPGHAVWTGSHEELSKLLKERRDLWVQDPASSLAVESITNLAPSVVIDACAGLGTKTRQLTAAFPNAQIIATDIDEPRRATLERVFAKNDQVTVIEHEQLLDHAGRADLVLLDVPCSNSGVLARRVEARYRFSSARTESLVSTQRQIVADAVRLLNRSSGQGSGRILYSTCSLSHEENEEISRWAARWHGFTIEQENRRSPSGGPGEEATTYSDGSYAALLA
ncbi:MAG: transcription antitermination factor NusB [Planctomycetota bacterium]